MSEKTLIIDKTRLAKNKACSYKNILGYIFLVIILAIFCISELAILSVIFIISTIFYIIIAIFGGVYLTAICTMKLSEYYKEKNKNISKN
ncbi:MULTISPECIES: hypothetical protein [Francisella]|uniref:Uncharacterized protein n=1 Tax=Francisella opportunistica TaxID=2016517 RepID=A0A345JSJ8_9GAMM|nr:MULTISPECIES: hypothetical protein [Francisella]APC92064.1 hypothetical protein BBG19_1336 [Francisella sp. MA067296]AXH30294.1 hypothetical protein CGC43_06740 [Francisella opportunistica]AXH31935.1 hypothetical protein CGC44_06720 [Francisella opportunistica]AXH33581.1 hypothetical protein CGC45_06735 [Francisella opportunistica]